MRVGFFASWPDVPRDSPTEKNSARRNQSSSELVSTRARNQQKKIFKKKTSKQRVTDGVHEEMKRTALVFIERPEPTASPSKPPSARRTSLYKPSPPKRRAHVRGSVPTRRRELARAAPCAGNKGLPPQHGDGVGPDHMSRQLNHVWTCESCNCRTNPVRSTKCGICGTPAPRTTFGTFAHGRYGGRV